MTPLDRLLESYRANALSERDKGAAFEKLVAAWLVADPVQAKRFTQVESWSEWAEREKRSRVDVGIDLVATRVDRGLAAVQCKFFDAARRIRKEDIDSFISASAKEPFTERLIVETTEAAWSPNADEMLHEQRIPTGRIGLRELRDSRVDWSGFEATGTVERPAPKTLRPDQVEAMEAAVAGLAEADRGKLIMACGTGKTFTSLRIAEELAGAGGHVLFLVPSLALMAQTVREWCADATVPMTSFAVCSDAQVGRRRRHRDDVAEIEVTDLAFPATTDGEKLAREVGRSDGGSMRVVFATYQSIQVVVEAQWVHGLPEFDLIVCDEAHRTTGVTFGGKDESNFVKVHNNDEIRGKKRIYMTATPRIYGETARSRAQEMNAVLASMDDADMYGEVLFHHGFARAVESGILTDYRVIVLAMDEGQVSGAVQKRLADENTELLLDDATKIVGCWKALSKIGLEGAEKDPDPMCRALAFCRSIARSKLVRDEFGRVVDEFRLETGEDQGGVSCEVRHVDGTQNARERGQRLDWLKEDGGSNVCRILTNARCLTEGVDVPALDAILFLHPRNSQIDVVQAVGRVMRKSPDKRMGYVILPVGVPPDISTDVALADNKRYRVVWQILNALRAHDERLDAVINQGGLGQNVTDRIVIVDGRTPVDPEIKAVTATIETLPAPPVKKGPDIGKGGRAPTPPTGTGSKPEPVPDWVIDDFSRAVMAKIVEKCGTRDYWEDWAADVAEIAERHVTRIEALVHEATAPARAAFEDFLRELRDDLNESISERDAIEMLAQHLITRPVFEALFEGHAFVDRNPVSVAMTNVLSQIDQAKVARESKELERFYASVRRRAAGITDPMARQNLVVELYDKFFRGAFPRTTKMLGIVYTPVEIVDFIIRSVNDVLEDEFGQNLGSKGVHILDPFTGTGTFITRLLQSGLISPEDIERKYREEIHANEIVLLAYYIAAINIESAFHSVSRGRDYVPFTGICLTDTFSLHERDDELSFYMKDNSDRRQKQKNTDIRVVIGNPPYSKGQRSEDDNAKNVAYATLDRRIRSTYAARSNASSLPKIYDSYIRAIRWGSDRIGESGIMAFVTGSAWIERAFADGMRRSVVGDYSSIYVFHLRGDIRKNMLSRGRAGEGENIFGQGSMTGVAITVFVKNPNTPKQGRIQFHDIGDCLSREKKLEIVNTFGSIRGIQNASKWTSIVPDEYGDWLDQRDPDFEAYPRIGDKKNRNESVIFRNYSLGVATNRDAWCINPSRDLLSKNVDRTIRFYNGQMENYRQAIAARKSLGAPSPDVTDFIKVDRTKIAWTHSLKTTFKKLNRLSPSNDGLLVPCMYRPFNKEWQFYSRRFNERVYQMPAIFPNAELSNRVIAVNGKGSRNGFSALMSDCLVNLNLLEAGSQCFPLYLYRPRISNGFLCKDDYVRVEAVTDFALRTFRESYPQEIIDQEDIFYYVYGLLHSGKYRSQFRSNLVRNLPHIPCVTHVEDYRAFRDAGYALGKLHIGYEDVDLPLNPNLVIVDETGRSLDDAEKRFRVTKMRHPGRGKNKDRSTIVYNPHITVRGIPEEAWDYVVNGRPALSWVMERQCVKTHKPSGIVSDANRYAVETVGDPRYPLDLLLRVITVSLETTKIVRSLPDLVID